MVRWGGDHNQAADLAWRGCRAHGEAAECGARLQTCSTRPSMCASSRFAHSLIWSCVVPRSAETADVVVRCH